MSIKRFSVLLAVCVLLTSLAACSGGGAPSSPAPSAAPASPAAPASSAASAPTEIDWPRKAVEIVVPAGAGGDTDFNARLFAAYLTEELGASFVVSNVTGSGGTVGTRQVKDASPDGQTVLFYHSAFVCNELSQAADFGFEAFDFACIAAMSAGNCITVNSSTGFKNIQDLVDYSKEHPGELTIAAQTGATTQATALLLQKVAGADLTIVDAGGAADRLASLLGGHVDVITNAYGNIKDYVQDGTLTPLALDGLNDLEEFGITSIRKQGFDMGFPFYYFFAFPKGTDPQILEKFNASVENIVHSNAEYEQKIAEAYFQKPTYFAAAEGVQKFQEVYDLLDGLDFNA